MRLLDLNVLLADKLTIYSKPSEGKSEEVIMNPNYNSVYFNCLGNILNSMLMSINNLDKHIDNLEI